MIDHFWLQSTVVLLFNGENVKNHIIENLKKPNCKQEAAHG